MIIERVILVTLSIKALYEAEVFRSPVDLRTKLTAERQLSRPLTRRRTGSLRVAEGFISLIALIGGYGAGSQTRRTQGYSGVNRNGRVTAFDFWKGKIILPYQSRVKANNVKGGHWTMKWFSYMWTPQLWFLFSDSTGCMTKSW